MENTPLPHFLAYIFFSSKVMIVDFRNLLKINAVFENTAAVYTPFCLVVLFRRSLDRK